MRNDCCFADKCLCRECFKCKHYSPTKEQNVAEELRLMVELERLDFRAEWFSYISEWT